MTIIFYRTPHSFRISLADIAEKLQLDSAEDAEYIVAKVIMWECQLGGDLYSIRHIATLVYNYIDSCLAYYQLLTAVLDALLLIFHCLLFSPPLLLHSSLPLLLSLSGY